MTEKNRPTPSAPDGASGFSMGHVTRKGAPAVQTTALYTQVSREEIKEKLKLLRS